MLQIGKKKKQMLERIGVTFAASQECSKLAIGMFCVLFMLLGILQLHLSSENGHFLGMMPQKPF